MFVLKRSIQDLGCIRFISISFQIGVILVTDTETLVNVSITTIYDGGF